MAIQVRDTPNPNARKYVVPDHHFPQPQNYSEDGRSRENPLASVLLAVEGIYNVFMAQDFITVNKRPAVAWEVLQPQILALIGTYLGCVPLRERDQSD